jgi:hypothetical protein
VIADFDDSSELTRLVLPTAADAGTAGAPGSPAGDPLSGLEEFASDPFAPSGARPEWDVASDELDDAFPTEALTQRVAAPAAPVHDDATPPTFTAPLFDDDAAAEFELTEIAAPTPRSPAAPASSAPPGAAPELSGAMREQVHATIEKIAWEALGDVSERIVREAVARIEQVAWEVIPRLTETLIREEIRKLKGEE